MASVIYHNPKCSTSRFVLEVLQLAGEAPEIVLYLQEGWTKAQLKVLMEDSGLSAKDILRTRNTAAQELGLTKDSATEDDILDAMIVDPVLVERPLIRTSKGVAMCRPKTRVFDMLSNQTPRRLTMKNGEELDIPMG